MVLIACLGLPIVKSLRPTLRRRWPLLPRLCNLSYIGEFCFSLTRFLILTFLLGLSLNDLMTVAVPGDSDDSDDSDVGGYDDETASG